MANKLVLAAASLGAALVLAIGLAAAGFSPQAPAVDAMQAVDQVAPSDPAAPVQVDTIYLAPAATPEEITITKVKEASHHEDGEDHEGEHEAEDD